MIKKIYNKIKSASTYVRNILSKFTTSRTKPSFLKARSNFILQAIDGFNLNEIAINTQYNVDTVSLWVNRFASELPKLNDLSEKSPKDLENAIEITLSDKQRSGAGRKYDETVRKSVIFFCCQDIKDYNVEANRWSLRLLQHVMISEKVVKNISTGEIYSILMSCDLKPWRNRYYLHSKEKFENYEEFKKKVNRITFDYLLCNIHGKKLEEYNTPFANERNLIIKGREYNKNANEFALKDWITNAIEAAMSQLSQETTDEMWFSEDWMTSAIENAISEILNKSLNDQFSEWLTKDWMTSAIEDEISQILEERECFEIRDFTKTAPFSGINYAEENKQELINNFGFTERMLEELRYKDANFQEEINLICRSSLFERNSNWEDNDESKILLSYNYFIEDIQQYNPDLCKKIESLFRVYSLDENSGIQALEKRYPDIPARPATNARPGTPHREDFSYERHGTTGLIAYKDVLTGQIRVVYISQTRTEKDLGMSFYNLLLLNKDTIKISLVLDNLNTHCSEVMVRLVTFFCGYNIDLGKKGKSGILKNSETRMHFLSDPTHRVSLHYTPVHCSWLNQIEVEFSIFNRRFYKGNSFKSVEELEDRIANYFEMHNKFFAKPFKWSYHSVPKKDEQE